jgi:hypothetical protein
MTDAHKVRSADRLVKGDKLKMMVGAILIGATLLGVGELASTVSTADHGAPSSAIIEH